MNKILHYVLIVFVTMISNQLLAQQTTVEFNAGTDLGKYDGKKIKGGFNNGSDEISKDGITISVQNGAFAAHDSKGHTYRFYKGTAKVASTVGKIVKIEFTCDRKNPAERLNTTEGTWNAKGESGVWTGSADEVNFTISGKQMRATKIVVTYIKENLKPDEVAKPRFSGNKSFIGSTKVTITAVDGAKIYYAIDKDVKQQANRTEYTAPIELTQTSTINAIAILNDKESEVATQKFEKKEYTVVNSISEFNDLAEGTEAVLNINNGKVLYKFISKKGTDLIYIVDGTKGFVLYNTKLDLKENEDLNGSIILKSAKFAGFPQGQSIAGVTNLDKLTHTAGSPAFPLIITPSDAKNYLAQLVTVKNVTISSEEVANKKGTITVYKAKSAEEFVQLHNGFHLDQFNDLSSYVTEGAKYDITGIIGSLFNKQPSLYPLKIEKTTDDIKEINLSKINPNAPIYNLSGQRVDKNYKGIVIQKGNKFIQK